MDTKDVVKRCVRCIMDDSSDDTIVFNENGECDYCTNAFNRIGSVYLPNEQGQEQLNKMIEKLKLRVRISSMTVLWGSQVA